ncbi:oxygenase MpaB family protein, partial [Robbsia andropogonis]|uniref:oxygenase MpaB family protein n=1 Tax=Robbsia andropogonis TaxID=28092 RepID=UPI0020A18813
VHDWSRYREDPLSRLAGTVRWIVITTFGSTQQVAKELGRVARFHERVSGEYATTAGETRTYAATDDDLVDWVHVAFADSFLTCHEAWGE